MTTKYIEIDRAIETALLLLEEGEDEQTLAYNAALVAFIKNMENVPAADIEPRWIPCSERLPREFTRVIGYMAWKAMTAIEYQHGRWYSIDHLEPLPDEAVSHWMPLPQPPKEGDE